MKKYQCLLVIFITIISLFSCVSIKNTDIKPNQISIKNVFDWAILDADLFSWNGKPVSDLVKSWGNPNSQIYLAENEEQIEYSMSETIVSTTGSTFGLSNYSSTSSYTNITNNIQSSVSNKNSKVCFYIKRGMIQSVSYSGFYSQLKQLCKASYDKSKASNEIKNNYYVFLYMSRNEYITWSKVSTETLYKFLLPISSNRNKSNELLKYYEERALQTFQNENFKSQKAAANWVTICENNLNRGVYYEDINDIYSDINNINCIEQYLAVVKVYREMYENTGKNEINTLERYSSKRKYSLEDFVSGNTKWNEVSIEDLMSLSQYADPIISSSNVDFHGDVLRISANYTSKNQYIETIDYFINEKILDEYTILTWLAWIEYFYEKYPEEIIK